MSLASQMKPGMSIGTFSLPDPMPGDNWDTMSTNQWEVGDSGFKWNKPDSSTQFSPSNLSYGSSESNTQSDHADTRYLSDDMRGSYDGYQRSRASTDKIVCSKSGGPFVSSVSTADGVFAAQLALAYRPDVLVLTCEQCSERFTGEYRRRNLGRHMLSVHGDRIPFFCDVRGCTRSYKRSDALKVHLRKAHPDSVPPALPRRNAAGVSRGQKRQPGFT